MGEIKSAFEKAMEKVQQLSAPTKEEKLTWEGVPEGRRLAAEHLRGRLSLAEALDKCDRTLRPYVLRGIIEILTANIQLPRNQVAQESTGRALDGLGAVFRNTKAIKGIIDRVQYVCQQFQTHGEQQRQQLRQQLKEQFQAQLQEAVRRQTGGKAGVEANVEAMPEFQQEWLRLKVRLDQQYEQHLDEYRKEIQALG